MLLLHDVASENAGKPGITRNWATKNLDTVVGRDGGKSPAGHFCAVELAFNTSIPEEPPARRLGSSHSGSGSAGGRHCKFLFRLGQPDGLRSELLRVKPKLIVW